MLGGNCPVVTPTTKDSNMSLAEQSHIPGESTAPMQPESSVETKLSAESQQTPPTQGEARKKGSSVDDGFIFDSDSGSSSESGDESESKMESSAGPVVPSESSPDLPSRENLSVVQKAQVNQKQDSQKPGAASEGPETDPPSKGNQVKKKATPSNPDKTEKQVPKKKDNIEILERLSVTGNFS